MVACHIGGGTAQRGVPVLLKFVRQEPCVFPVLKIRSPENECLPVGVTVAHLNLITKLQIAAPGINRLAPHDTSRPVAVVSRTGIVTVHDRVAIVPLVIKLLRVRIAVVCALGAGEREPHSEVTPYVIEPLVELELSVQLVVAAFTVVGAHLGVDTDRVKHLL